MVGKIKKTGKKNFELVIAVTFLIIIAITLTIHYWPKSIPSKWESSGEVILSNAALAPERLAEIDSVRGDLKRILAELKPEVEGKNFQRQPYKDNEELIIIANLDYDRYLAVSRGIKFFAPGYNDLTKLPREVWDKIGISEVDGSQMFWHSGMNLAISFVELANLYYDPSGIKGDALLVPFEDVAEMMGYVIKVLDEINTKPEDIGSSCKNIRDIARKNLYGRIKKIRSEIRLGQVNRLQGNNVILKLAKRGIDDWHFSTGQLGLKPEEATRLMSGKKFKKV